MLTKPSFAKTYYYIKFLIKSEFALTEEIINKYIWKAIDNTNNTHVKNVHIYLQPEIIRIIATFKPNDLIPPIQLATAFKLCSWSFFPGDHRFTFQQVQNSKLAVENFIVDCLLQLTIAICEKIAVKSFISDIAMKFAARTLDYIEQDGDLFTIILDSHPTLGKILQQFDFVGIGDISIREGVIMIYPHVKLRNLFNKLRSK